ncbi:signal recognition particle-docking protein FtsY [Methylobacter sp.]|uniref:signal recognition particle-docking protein FtsY n=1 Tax=Methylobacter sp. TaxID=2051955 RepID=UPI001207E9EC|nr:signal recognition particle-docking protein FtsY [Methylobacter sp.]TAK59749.1 MAG: signal recognition particle-docking protein FtsY [Methylobacter sp.]
MFRKIALFSVVLALIVVIVGAYVRLSGAGLGCPDWPGCYGQAIPFDFAQGGVSDQADFKAHAAEAFPGQTPDIAKAWKEMTHRYLAAVLGLTVLVLALLSWRQKQNRLTVVTATFGLVVLIVLQAFLGMWAVKLHVMPIVVTGHLLLGMMTFWLLFWLYLRVNPEVSLLTVRNKGLVLFARFAMPVLLLEIVLGGWVSANYAALACSGFPQCNGSWWPQADYQTALDLFRGLDTGYTGVIAFDAQVAANWLHRVGALISFVVLTLLMLNATSAHHPKPVRRAGLWLSVLLLMQIGSGIIGVKLGEPLWVAVAHNAFAALLMLPLIAISFYSRYGYVEELKRPKAEPQREGVVVPTAEEAYPVAEPEPLYLRLRTQLKRTRSGLSGVLAHIPIGRQEIDKDLLEEIEASLLMADIGVDATTEIIKRLTESVERHQLNDGEALSAALKQELLSMLRPCSKNLRIPKQDKPFVILVVGVNGAGKTTTIGKLAKRLQIQGHSVMLAAGDTFRAAAVEQLQTWGERNNIHVVAQHTGADSASVIYDAVQSAQAKGVDVLIADTAGRLHTKSNLMDELKKVKRIISKLDETAPHEVLLVLDAGTGQNALSQAKLFNEAVELTGLALTKLDGTAKGGVIFALAKQFGIPIRFIGIGEGIDDLQDFDADAFVNALFVKD